MTCLKIGQLKELDQSDIYSGEIKLFIGWNLNFFEPERLDFSLESHMHRFTRVKAYIIV